MIIVSGMCICLERLDSLAALLIDDKPILTIIDRLEGPVSARTVADDLPGDFV